MMRMRSWFGMATLALVGMMAASAFAQQPGGGGRGRGGFGGPTGGMRSPLSLAAISAVQKELGVTEEQIAKLKTLGDEARAEMQAGAGGFEGLRDLPEAERRAKMTELMAKQAETARKVGEKFKPKLAEVLNATQVERLDQIALQAAGAQAYSDPGVAKSLKLSKEQQDKLASINKDFQDKLRDGGGAGAGGDVQDRFAKMREMGAARDKDLEAVLTADQKDQLAKLKGKAFDVAQLRGPGGLGGAGGAGGRPAGGRPRPDGEATPPRRPE